MTGLKSIVVTGAFDDIRSRQVRFLQEASKLGDVAVLLWSDELISQKAGKPPKFPQAERLYFLNAIRFVEQVKLVSGAKSAVPSAEPEVDVVSSAIATAGLKPDVWVVIADRDSAEKKAFCRAQGIGYHVLRAEDLRGFPEIPPWPEVSGPARKKVIVTGSYDWLHTGHVRFFEEASAHGDLYVTVGRDENIRLLKGKGHPLFPQEERRYLVGAIRFVKQAFVASGHGWLDAEQDIQRLKPDIYAVNEDGDRGGKSEYCQKYGIHYLVLKRAPAPGLPRRSSTELRGF